MMPRTAKNGFTLVELLVVVGIIALLIGLLLPVLTKANIQAKITQAKSDLRQINLALSMYQQDYGKPLPPTRFSCASRTEYELPMELAIGKYLPSETKEFGVVVKMKDVFNPETTYKYRAAGPAIMNESTLVSDASTLWVPSDFPVCQSIKGKYYSDAKTSPVRYAVWSEGPPVKSTRPDVVLGHSPIPASFWCRGSADGGVITIFEDQKGCAYLKP